MVGLGSVDWLLRAVQCRFNLSYFIHTLELFKYFVKIHKNHPSRAKPVVINIKFVAHENVANVGGQ